MITLSGLQRKLLERGVVMPLPWTELATRSFCCGSCVGSELPLVNQPKNTVGYVWFCEQSLSGMPELYLNWSLAGEFTQDQQVAFGYTLLDIFSTLGIPARWGLDTGETIILTIINYAEFEEWYAEEYGDDEEDEEDEPDTWSYQQYVEDQEEGEEHPEMAMDGWEDDNYMQRYDLGR